jgi:uncharacterized protein YyaL (SSP411 family)
MLNLRMGNRLARERSPYLLQHADNPVDWYPWGGDAFSRARREDKPIFLSVGYSTCHWCHVMAHESFESHAIADQLNTHFISIKVDREERPDVDRVYMLFVQSASQGRGGWPMSVWLTPDLLPFFGGTYYPRAVFGELIGRIAQAWHHERARVVQSASALAEQLRAIAEGGRGEAAPGGAEPGPVAAPDALGAAAGEYRRTFDRRFGGFGQAPKFPRPSELLLLLRAHARSGDADLLQMVVQTLHAMALGGMRDHLGGGIHRYAVDERWRVPHFEKMLYDQAQLAVAAVETAQASGDAFWISVADDTLAYVRRELAHPEGGFYSAEDADSVPPESAGRPDARKAEGAFYVWSAEEIHRLLGAESEVVALRFGIEPGGNAPHDPQGEFGTNNLLYTARSIDDVATRTGRSADEVADVLGRARGVLFEARATRPRPHLDDKVITAWNGLAIGALARLARASLDDRYDPSGASRRRYLDAADRAARFIERRLWNAASARLWRTFRDGQAAIDAYCEDYASLIWGLLELFQAGGDPQWIAWARHLQTVQDELFWDDVAGGWFSTSGQDPSVLLRLKEDYDGAEPAASSLGVWNALTLAHLTGTGGLVERAGRTLARFGPRIGEAARALPFMLCGLAAWHAGGRQIVIVGHEDDPETLAMHRVLARRYLPFTRVIPVTPGERQAELALHMPYVASMTGRDGRPTAYVCRECACLAPVNTPAALAALLDDGTATEP